MWLDSARHTRMRGWAKIWILNQDVARLRSPHEDERMGQDHGMYQDVARLRSPNGMGGWTKIITIITDCIGVRFHNRRLWMTCILNIYPYRFFTIRSELEVS
ncbi:hypothetical protein [Sphingobacterium sp.]|uniref:hypothetical protein n=1 Tax=Sphingobacterium sp. TaxID=341027 RepID=UPI0028AD9008|nr:hypothetical protein [Sphingobacterium sp.]